MSDILLIYPNMPEEEGSYGQEMMPLGLTWLAAYLEQQGYRVRILDLQVEQANIRQVIAEDCPKVVGIGGTTESRFESIRIAREVKLASPSIRTVYGGPHATFVAEDVLSHIPEFDFVVIGEGEQTTLELMRVLEGGNSADFARIRGLAFRDGKSIVITPPRDRIANLDSLPLPARHLLKMDRYHLAMDFLGIKGEQVITTRGCPVNCTFCSASALWGKRYTMRSAEGVVAEIRQVVEQYGARGIKFFDSTLTLNRSHIDNLCLAMLKSGLNSLPWECEIRVDTVDYALLKSMRDAGCYYVDMGMESASERVLRSIGKRITVSQVKQVISWAEELGLRTKLFMTWGHPNETIEDMKETLAFANKWRTRVTNLSGPRPIRIYPGTAVERFAREIGCLPPDFSWSMPYYNEEGKEFHISPYVPPLIQKRLGYAELRQMKLKNYVGKQASLSNILKKCARIRSFDDMRRHWNTLQTYLGR
jgi:anaerobic magnesium-protoporphyrin IX monomethyl ester cyclase